LIGIKLIDGVICPSAIKCREFCRTLPINDCELVGAFEFESAECGDGDPPFDGRLEFIEDGHGWISRTELTGIGSLCRAIESLVVLEI
jgi:hypothetical protein